MFRYRLYGFELSFSHKLKRPIHSNCIEHADLTASLFDQSDDFLIDSENWRKPVHSDKTTESAIHSWESNEWQRFDFYRQPEVALRFYLHKAGKKLFISKSEQIPEHEVEAFLIGSIAGRSLRLQGVTCLHSSVLEYQGKAFAILGPTGAGKSTTAAALLNAGARLISDDIGALVWRSELPYIESGYPAVRLLPQTMGVFGLNPEQYDPVMSVDYKRYVPLITEAKTQNKNTFGWQFHKESCQLSGIYVLSQRDSSLQQIQFQNLSQQQSMIALAPHIFATHMMGHTQQRKAFMDVAKLVRNIQVRSVSCPDHIESLPIIAEQILSDFCATLN